jgi:hypothetical protein
LLKNINPSLKTTPVQTHKYLYEIAKQKGAKKIIAKTWLFLQNENIANRMGYKLIKGTEIKLINKLKEISLEKKVKPHIQDVNF